MRRFMSWVSVIVIGAVGLSACGGNTESGDAESPTVVVSTAVLGSIVREVVGDAATVEVLMPNGVDPHGWEASAKDIESLSTADFVVINGLHLEQSLDEAVDEARSNGVIVFDASDHVNVIVNASETDDDHSEGDPHIWTDAAAMADVALAMGDEFAEAGIDVGDRASVVYERLLTLDNDLRKLVDEVDASERKLVTGHESLAYLAARYEFELVGAVIPGLSSESEVSAGELAELKDLMEAESVGVIFSEAGTPDQVVQAIADETGADVVELDTHLLPPDGSYETFMTELVSAIVSALSS
ncbi:MAG: metal ABC transporter substrate-binding protein [Ilumatobacteraceae bacterium]